VALTAINKLLGDGVKYVVPLLFMPIKLAIAQICEENTSIALIMTTFKSEGGGILTLRRRFTGGTQAGARRKEIGDRESEATTSEAPS
jgi:hypothetical protein